METQQIVKRGKGRPKNSVCFTNITLAELNAKFGQDQVLPIGRIFLEGNKITSKQIYTPKPTEIHSVATPFIVETPTVEMTLQA